MAERPLGLAAAAHPQLDEPAARLVLCGHRPGRLHGRTGAGPLPGALRRLVRRSGAREHDRRTRRGARRWPARGHRPADLARAQRGRGDRDREPGLRAAGRRRDRPPDPPADRRPLPGTSPDSRRRSAGGRRLGVRSPDRRRAAPVRATGHHLGGPAFPGTAPLPGPRHSLVAGPRRDPRPDHRSDARRTVGPPGAVASAVRPQRLPGRPGGARGGRGDAGRPRRGGWPAAELRR